MQLSFSFINYCYTVKLLLLNNVSVEFDIFERIDLIIICRVMSADGKS